MIHSVRGRLALWYAGVFAVFLTAFAVAAYAFLRGSGQARIDEFLAETASAVAGAMEYERNSGESDSAAVAIVVREFRLRETEVVIYDRALRTLQYARAPLSPKSTAAQATVLPEIADMPSLLGGAPSGASSVRTVRVGDEDLRVYVLPYVLGSRHLMIGTAQSLRALTKSLREAGYRMLFGFPLLLALATLGGYLLARKSLGPVAAMTERAAAIGARSLHERLPVENPRDELGRLATVFNLLLDRLERAFEDQRRFMADASHELRTPVAVISGESELALARADRTPGELRDALEAVRAESKRMRTIVDDLFLLARTEAGERPLRLEELYLRDLVEECVRSARSLAAARHIALSLDPGDDDLPCRGDETLLKRLVMNLLDNAVKYTHQGGRVTVRCSGADGTFSIEVEDTGVGIASAAQEHIFDRFYRAANDGDSAPRGDGAGLGLAIARWVARAHGGDLALVHSSPGGSLFRVTLPAPAPHDAPSAAPSPVPANA